MVRYADILQARDTIGGLVRKTPLFTSRTLDDRLQARCFLKAENLQRTGSFKFRGVCNRLSHLPPKMKEKGVITHSSGNHAQALALAGVLLKIRVVVVMPANAPGVKVRAVEGYGARVVRCENSMRSRETVCGKLVRKHGYTLVHGYDDDLIIAGAGTVALEFLEAQKKLDFLFSPLGGGGLLSGTVLAARGFDPPCRVIGVEPELADDGFRSLRDGRIYPSDYPDTIADGLRTSLCQRTFSILQKGVDQIITVSDDQIVRAMKFLWERMKLVAEPSGAVALAGMMARQDLLAGKAAGAIISGGNLDLDSFFDEYFRRIHR